MSKRTYVCAQCGAIRRRPAVYLSRSGQPSGPTPVCDGVEMRPLAKGYAEAATKLTPAERVRWLAAGGQILRRLGRRWKAAITPREVALAREQLAQHQADRASAS